jgi:hypothetical protein
MSKIPPPTRRTAAAIDAWHESQQEPPRPHLGVSLIGHHCERWIWLSFRWAVVEQFPGRILRLFRRGHLEEQTAIADLRAIGVTIEHCLNDQLRISYGSHVSGSPDGLITGGLPESSKPHLLEIKTHSDKSFKQLLSAGLKESKPQHFAQMQVGMHGLKVERGFYYAVNKNTDEIYTERIKYDPEVAQKYIDRGHRLAIAEQLPPPISTDATWYQCRMCPAHSFCHEGKDIERRNCRTCFFSTPKSDGKWYCDFYDAEIPTVEAQREGCAEFIRHPDLGEINEKDGLVLARNYWPF